MALKDDDPLWEQHSGRGGRREPTGHRINAEATRGSAGGGEGARHRRVRVPTAEARVGAKGKGRTELGGYIEGYSDRPVEVQADDC